MPPGPQTVLPPPATAVPGAAVLQADSPERAVRQRLLGSHVHEYVRRANVTEGFGYGFWVFSTAGTVLGVATIHEDAGLGATWTIGFGLTTLAAGCSMAASRDTRVDIFDVLTLLDAGVAFLGVAVADDPGDMPRLSTAATTATFFAEGLLRSINHLARTSHLTLLRADRDRLEHGQLSSAELAAVEARFLETEEPLGPGVLALPFFVGGGIALVPALDGRHNSNEQTFSAVFGSLLALDGVFSLFIPSLVPHYKAGLSTAGLSLVAGPGQTGFRYRF
ncbi:MAG TPA: hypothetical protein VLJ38_15320 [Polyangiaceae bacterium]|nr:hypothetical protein [Polyangiaceae bacterium]